MLVSDLINALVQITFIALTLVAGLDYIRYRHPTRLKILLMLASLSATLFISVVAKLLEIKSRWLSLIGALALLAHPFLLLRLVEHFQVLHRWILWLSMAGLLISAAGIILFDPLPAPITLMAVAYFAICEIYAALAFVQGAQRSEGVTRRRFRLAAGGSGVLGSIFIAAGFMLIFPQLTGLLSLVVQVAALISAVAYYLAFATPRWLSRFWRSSALLDFLRASTEKIGTGSSNRETLLSYLEKTAANSVGGDGAGVGIWEDGTKTKLSIHNTNSDWRIDPLLLTRVIEIIDRDNARAQVFYGTSPQGEAIKTLFETTEARVVYIVPVKNSFIDVGYLVIFSRQEPLFLRETLDFLDLLAQQCTLVLENQRLVDRLHGYNEALEREVQERTAKLLESEGRYHRIIDNMLEEDSRFLALIGTISISTSPVPAMVAQTNKNSSVARSLKCIRASKPRTCSPP